MKCPKCQSELTNNSKFCNHCGYSIGSQKKTCPNSQCSLSNIPFEAMFCPDCGTKLKVNKEKKTEVSVTKNPKEKLNSEKEKNVNIITKTDIPLSDEDSGDKTAKVVLILIVSIIAIVVGCLYPTLIIPCVFGGGIIAKMIWNNL
ncbi:MAG: Double zinc ribbon [Bacteroidetes bacterium]|nr:Double zinc ribbon [Bacteroidota bacterium]